MKRSTPNRIEEVVEAAKIAEAQPTLTTFIPVKVEVTNAFSTEKLAKMLEASENHIQVWGHFLLILKDNLEYCAVTQETREEKQRIKASDSRIHFWPQPEERFIWWPAATPNSPRIHLGKISGWFNGVSCPVVDDWAWILHSYGQKPE